MKGVGSRIRRQTNRQTKLTITLLSALLLVALAGFAVSPIAAGTADAGQASTPDVEPASQQIEVANSQPVVLGGDYDGNVTIPEYADQNVDYGIVPTDNKLEIKDDRVFVSITAQDLGDVNQITGFDFNVRWDPYKLQLESIQPQAEAAIRATPEDFQVNTGAPGFADVEWSPSSMDVIIDKLAPLIEDDVDRDGLWPEMNDSVLMKMEFTPTPYAKEGDVADVWVEPKDTTIYHGIFDWGLAQYENDNIHYGKGQVEIVPESMDAAVEDPVGEFQLVSKSGGYVGFGRSDDPGTSNALATLPAGEIYITGQFNESGYWEASDIRFPKVKTRTGTSADVAMPNGLSGYIDPANETMNVTGTMDIWVGTLSSGFQFEVDMQSGKSNSMQGTADWDFSMDNPNDAEASLTVVDNEFIVTDEEASDVASRIKNEANLNNAQSPGKNWVKMPFSMEITEFTGKESFVHAKVVDENGDPIENASVNVVDYGSKQGVTNSTGEVYFSGLQPGEVELEIDAQGYEATDKTLSLEVLKTTDTTVEMEPGEPDFNVDLELSDTEVFAGDPIVAIATVNNTDIGNGEQQITLSANGKTVANETVSLGGQIDSEILERDQLESSETEVSFEWVPEEPGDYTVDVSSDDDNAFTSVTVKSADEKSIDAILEGSSVEGGFISFNQAGSNAKAEGLLLPPNGDEVSSQSGDPIEVEGDVTGTTWQSTRVSFPDLSVSGLVGKVEAPLGLEGTYDPENNLMTVQGTLSVSVLDSPGGSQLGSFSFEVNATTGTSGELSGEADLGKSGGSVVVVDNEYVVPEKSGNSNLDGAIGLPSKEQGTNWLQLNFEFDAQQVNGTLERGNVAGTVSSENGETIEGATVTLGNQEVKTNASGQYLFENIDAGDYDMSVDADGYQNKTMSVNVTADQTTQQDVTLAAGQPEFDIKILGGDARVGETLEVTGTISNTGNGPGTLEPTISVADKETSESVEVGVGATKQVTLEWDVEEGDVGDYEATIEANGETKTADVTVKEKLGGGDGGVGIQAKFTAKTTGGFISFDEKADSARSEGLPLPPSDKVSYTNQPIVIEGQIFDSGVWQSTDISFPDLNTENDGSGLDAAVSVPGGLEGQIDMENGKMTAEGTFQVAVTSAEGNPSFQFDIAATTGSSGELSGESNLGGESKSATLVDNEYLAPQATGSTLIDSALGLPITEEGRNWLEMDLAMDVTEVEGDLATGTVEGVVESSDGEGIEGATVETDLTNTQTASDGSYQLSVQEGSQNLTVSADGYSSQTVTVDVTKDQTTTKDIQLSQGSAELNLSVGMSDGGSVQGTVENTGTAPANETVSLEVNGETVEKTVEVAPGESETVTMDNVETDEVNATLEAGGETINEEGLAQEGNESESDGGDGGDSADIRATSTGGFMATAEDTKSAAQESLSLPPQEDKGQPNPVEILGNINEEEGTWESTKVVFPKIITDQGIEADVSAPDGLTGEIDKESGKITMQGTLVVDIRGSDATFEFELDATTGESGALTGSADFDDEGGSATLVDNQYTIPEATGDAIIDNALSLPADEAGKNWFQMNVNLKFNASSEIQQEEVEDGDDSDDGGVAGFLPSFGMLIGMIGLAGGFIAVLAGLASRFIASVDPDPGRAA